jgi:8-oxo-dGTP pyrophosphatase MutT (NUDIX family)
MSSKGSLIGRVLIPAFGGLYNDLIGRRTHLGVAAVIFDNQGSVLLVHQSYGHRGWDLPGGGREAKESLHDAIRREVREEVGLEITSAELTGVYYEPGVDQHHFAFRCEVRSADKPIATPPEIVEVGFFSRTALPRPVNDFTMQQIEDALSANPLTVRVLGKRQWLT